MEMIRVFVPCGLSLDCHFIHSDFDAELDAESVRQIDSALV